MYYELICKDNQGISRTRLTNVSDATTLVTAVEKGGWVIIELKLIDEHAYKSALAKNVAMSKLNNIQSRAENAPILQSVQSSTIKPGLSNVWKCRDPSKPIDPLNHDEAPDFLSMSKDDLFDYFDDTPFDIVCQQLCQYTRKSLVQIHNTFYGCNPLSADGKERIVWNMCQAIRDKDRTEALLGKVCVPNDSVPDFLSMSRGELIAYLKGESYEDAYSQLRQYNHKSLKVLYSTVFGKEPSDNYGKRSIIWELCNKIR